MRLRMLRPLPVALLVLAFSAPIYAQRDDAAPEKKSEFLRFVDDSHGGGTLQTALATYRDDAGVTVHLVAAVHIGEKSYYNSLNKTFRGYDAVLYEMVKPKDAPVPQPGEQRNNSIISVIQRFMKDALELQFQLDAIDYTRPNFVHADLDYETFEKLEAERGESIWTLMLQQMLREMTNPQAQDQPQMDITDLLGALTSPDRARQLKLLLARQFGHIEEQMSSFGGTVLITDRNKACFKVLKQEMADGKKDLGIFYGAGHMGDMENRLLSMGFHKTGQEWRIAWNMAAGADNADKDRDDAQPAPRKARPRHDSDDDEDGAKGIIKVEYSGISG